MGVATQTSGTVAASRRRGHHTSMASRSPRRRPPRTQTRRAIRRPPARSEHYWDITHRPLQCLVFLLPFVLAYEVGMALLHGRLHPDDRPSLAAQQLLHWFFSLFGATGFYLPGAALVVVLLGWHLASHYPWRVPVQPLLGMGGESILLAIPLLFLNRWIPVLRGLSGHAGGEAGSWAGPLDNLLLSVGAGLYEELVFRLIVISLITLLLIDIGRVNQVWGVALAVIFSSLLFAAHHYYPIGADAWSLPEFTFRTAAGAYLAAVFVMRGFGLAVGCHVTYDVIAFLL
jgi:hypothetical protein